MMLARQAGSYRDAFPFALCSPEDYPEDFSVPETRDEFRAGLEFLRELRACELEIGVGGGELWRTSWPIEYQAHVESFGARQKKA